MVSFAAMSSHRHALDTLLELQALDRVPRSGYAVRGVADAESVSEHSFHLVFLAWALAAEEESLDATRVMELALLHDVAEVRFGDLPRSAAHYLPAGAKARAEAAAAADILAPLGRRATDLHAEYAAQATPEARFVAACDKLQLVLKAAVYEGWGHGGLDDFLDRPERFLEGEFDSVRRVFAELWRRRGHDILELRAPARPGAPEPSGRGGSE